MVIKVVMGGFFGIIIGLIFSNTGNGQSGIANRSGVLLFVCINQVCMGWSVDQFYLRCW